MQRIREGLYLLESARAVNVYLIAGSQGLSLVDTGPASSVGDLVRELHDGGFKLEDVQRIVATHAHPDHMGGAAELLRLHRVKVFAHPADIPALEGKAPAPLPGGVGGFFKSLPLRLRGRIEPLTVAVPASPREPIRGLPQWQVLHTPGHTPGSLSLFDPAHQVLLCGDALSNRGGRLSVADGVSCDEAGASETYRRLAALDVDVLCPGHGPAIRPRAWSAIEALGAAPKRA